MEPFATLLLRIVIGMSLGGIIGYERDRHGRPAGLRTHMLVALASATFMVVSTNFVFAQHYHSTDLVAIDPSRIAASIVTGIGFLAGGAILRQGTSIQGLTTAAGLWLVGAIGMASGAGMYPVACFVTVCGVIALTLLRRFEDKDDRQLRRHVELMLGPDGKLADIAAALGARGVTLTTLRYDRHVADRHLDVTLDVTFPRELGLENLIAEIEQQHDVRRIRIGHVS
ncbi:MAG: MgtC/SapB family protein [Polyangia bacterium]